jgi:16S rRNA (uracil1498-N3)-methyltransferase
MHRFYLPPEQWKETTVFLDGREAHHALHVLRLRSGEQVAVLDGNGGELICEIQGAQADTLTLRVLRRNTSPAPPFRVTLLQAVPKGQIMESIIQKATELGAHRVVPLITERVATRLDAKDAVRKAAKWQQVAIEAIKQCGSLWLPKIETPVAPADFLARHERFDLPLIASLQPGSRHAREYFQQFQAAHKHKPESACVWIGPEGDFTPEEVAAVQATGALPISLGPLVLRVETAATYCLSILNYELRSAP